MTSIWDVSHIKISLFYLVMYTIIFQYFHNFYNVIIIWNLKLICYNGLNFRNFIRDEFDV